MSLFSLFFRDFYSKKVSENSRTLYRNCGARHFQQREKKKALNVGKMEKWKNKSSIAFAAFDYNLFSYMLHIPLQVIFLVMRVKLCVIDINCVWRRRYLRVLIIYSAERITYLRHIISKFKRK